METDGRSAIVIKPKQPYADWAESVNEPGDPPANLDSLRREVTQLSATTSWSFPRERSPLWIDGRGVGQVVT